MIWLHSIHHYTTDSGTNKFLEYELYNLQATRTNPKHDNRLLAYGVHFQSTLLTRRWTVFLRNNGMFLSYSRVSYPRRRISSQWPPSQPQTSHVILTLTYFNIIIILRHIMPNISVELSALQMPLLLKHTLSSGTNQNQFTSSQPKYVSDVTKVT